MRRFRLLVSVFWMASGAALCRAEEAGLVAHYRFDEGSGDVAGDATSFHAEGKVRGAKWVKLPQGHALEFDGIDDHVDCGSPPQLDLRGPLTMMAWVCPGGVQPASEPGILGKQFSSFLVTYYLNRKLFAYINSGGNNTYATVMPEQWSHIAYAFDGSFLRIYVNGRLANEKQSLFSYVNSGGKFFIGMLMGDPSATDPNYQRTFAFKGMIDEVKVYSRSLSAEEVKAECRASDVNRNEMFRAIHVPVSRGEYLRSGDLSVCVGKSGAVQVNRGRSSFVLQSSYSFPGAKIGWNELTATTSGNPKSWKPRVRKLGKDSLVIEARNGHYAFKRVLRFDKGRLTWEDTLTNVTRQPVGILISHLMTTPRAMTNARAMTTADNPTIFFSQPGGDFGIVADDDVARLQFESSCIANSAKLKHSHFALGGGKSYTFRYSIYPLKPTGDWLALINRVRQDWKSNFTVLGPWDWIDVYHSAAMVKDKQALKKWIERKNLKIISLSPWLEYDPGYMDHVISREEWKAMMQPAAKAIHEVAPEVKVIGCIETDWVTLYPETMPNGQVLYNGAPADFTKVLDASDHPWKDSAKRDRYGQLALERYTRGNKPQIALSVYPAPGNAQEKFLLDQAQFIMDEVGLDGFYIDEFNQAWSQSIRSYAGWDGVSVDVDPDTGGIASRFVNCSLAGIPSRVKIINAALSRNKIIVTNTYATSLREQPLPAYRFWEMQSFLDISVLQPGQKPPLVYELCEGLLASPIGLGVTQSPAKPNLAEGLMLGMISYLRHGLLYYHYWYPDVPETGDGSGEYGPINHSFPMTPVGIHEGWMEGKERIITCVSGSYNWRNQRRPTVLLFGLDGREKANEFATTRTDDGWRVDVALKDWAEIAVVE